MSTWWSFKVANHKDGYLKNGKCILSGVSRRVFPEKMC